VCGGGGGGFLFRPTGGELGEVVDGGDVGITAIVGKRVDGKGVVRGGHAGIVRTGTCGGGVDVELAGEGGRDREEDLPGARRRVAILSQHRHWVKEDTRIRSERWRVEGEEGIFVLCKGEEREGETSWVRLHRKAPQAHCRIDGIIYLI